jgi:L-threonine-O-3-phosphate decarboxylase
VTRPTHGGNLDWAASLVNCPTSAIIDFSASINPLGPPKSAMEAIYQGLSQLKNYPNPDYPQFCEIIAQKHQLTPQWVLPSNGAAELLTWVAWEIHTLKGVLLPAPCFADYKRALATFDVDFISYSLDALEQGFALAEQKKFALLINNPHNPTGKLWTKEILIPHLDNFALVIVDEAFMDFLPPNDQESLIEMVKNYDNLVILRSLTKFYSLPGLRIGYGISNPIRIERWRAWRDPWSVNTLAALAGCAVLQDQNFEKLTWQWLANAKPKLFQQLTSIEQLQVFPSSANFLLIKSQIPASQLQLKLLQQEHIFIRDCLSFPELGDNYFRVAIKQEEENEKLSRAISRLCNQLLPKYMN